MENRIEKFIEENELDFSDTGSSLNSNCVVISGYACHLDLDWDELLELFPKKLQERSVLAEIVRVFTHAYLNNYGEWWNTEKAHKMYKF